MGFATKLCRPCREQDDGLYRSITYLTAKMVEESVIVLLNSLAFTALVFFPIYLSGSYLVFFMVCIIFNTFALL